MTVTGDSPTLHEQPHLPWSLLTGDRTLLRDDTLTLSRGEVGARAEAVAEQLAELGVGRGDVVAVMVPNRVELLVCLLAAWRLGAVGTPVNPAFTASEANRQLSDSGARLVVTEEPVALACPALPVSELRARTVASAPGPVPLADDDLALLIYTSGSTGAPKGVMLDHGNAAFMTGTFVTHLDLTEDDHCLLVLPLFHVNALMVSALAMLRVGGQLSLVGQFSVSRFFDDVERLRPTYFSAVPTIYSLLAALPEDVQPDTSSVRVAICGAAPMSAPLLTALSQRFGFPVIEGYGLTEATCASACNPVHGVQKVGTVGPALPGQQIRVVRADGSTAAPGEPGEVLIAGPALMRGYLNQPEATTAALADGWLHTGDVGVLDGDGYLRLVDRIKDMIIRGGENLYPKEIEVCLQQVHGVLEVAVVGVPDPVLGEVPVAFVVTHPASRITSEELMAHAREHLTRTKVPIRIDVVTALPKNPVGKIDKPTIRTLSTTTGLPLAPSPR